MLFKRNKGPHAELEKAIGYSFRKKSHLDHALLHRSLRFENSSVHQDNQRLEFLGDAVLGLLTAAYVYSRFSDSDEGGLTSFRSQVASGRALAHCARELKLGDYLRMGKGEERSGGRHRPNLLADALEAVIGAAYLDGGLKACEKIFENVFAPRIAALSGDVWDTNPKGKLQELAQRRWKTSPHYRTVQQNGPAHATVFTAEVVVNGLPRGVGQGSSKQDAERQAAQRALAEMANAAE
jgi:ribonuclease III